MPTVAVFAGSKNPTDPEILKAATTLGRKLAEAGYEVSYGGGTQGVMGAIARSALAAGGKVNAIVVEQYKDEPQFPFANIIEVKTEQERFKLLTTLNNPVASFALPGSAGSMREVFQALELAVYENGPDVVLVKVGKYLDGLKDAFELSVAAGMTKPDKADKLKTWSPDSNIAEVLPAAAKNDNQPPKQALSR